jgi:glycosyltransferase involved in cell wall biosynthesis
MPPLVSCVIVTRNRRPFVAKALQYFRAQTYENRELIVVDDGTTSVEKLCAAPDVRYVRLTRSTPTGEKLNLGIERARGRILQKWDDDDYYGPHFLSTAVSHLQPRRGNVVVAWCCFGVFIAGDPQLYFSGHGWHAGGTLCFRRALWERHPFRPEFRSEDSWFLRDHQPRVVRACAPDQYIVVRHGANTWRRIRGHDSVEGYFKRRCFPRSLRSIIGPRHAAFYRSLRAPSSSWPSPA